MRGGGGGEQKNEKILNKQSCWNGVILSVKSLSFSLLKAYHK